MKIKLTEGGGWGIRGVWGGVGVGGGVQTTNSASLSKWKFPLS